MSSHARVHNDTWVFPTSRGQKVKCETGLSLKSEKNVKACSGETTSPTTSCHALRNRNRIIAPHTHVHSWGLASVSLSNPLHSWSLSVVMRHVSSADRRQAKYVTKPVGGVAYMLQGSFVETLYP